MPDKDALKLVLEWSRIDQEELRIWRENYPRWAADIREIAIANVEGRKPNLSPPRIYG